MKDYYKIVKKHYDQEAIKQKLTSHSTMPDKNVRILEIRNILKYLDEDSKCLEIGCGNGWASVEISKSKKINLTSMEINNKMFKLALKQPKNKIKGELEFIHKDILKYSKKN